MLFRENGFDEKQIEEVFNKIMEHHDALRMIYKEKEGEIIQYNRGYDKNLFDLYIHDVKGVENKEEKVYEIATNIQKEMDIKEGKLVKLCIFKSDEGRSSSDCDSSPCSGWSIMENPTRRFGDFIFTTRKG